MIQISSKYKLRQQVINLRFSTDSAAISSPVVAQQFWKITSNAKRMSSDQRTGVFPETRTKVELLDDEGRLAQRGHWIGAHLVGDAAIPDKKFAVVFEGKTLFVLPEDGENMPAAFLKCLKHEAVELRGVISRFLSAWSWAEGRGLRVANWTSGSLPYRSSGQNFKVRTTRFDFEELPTDLPKAAAIALAHYREGLALQHVAYSFLSFYKVINAVFKNKEEQRRWMRDNVDLIDDERAQKRLKELRQDPEVKSVQDYIYTACRNAVAHSHPDFDPVDPDDPTDEIRLSKDLPVVKALARRLINTEIGLETADQFWDSKTRRIIGARWMIGQEVVAQIDSGAHVPRRAIQLPKRVRLKSRRKNQQPRLENLNFRVTDAENGVVGFKIWSEDDAFGMLGELNFRQGDIGVDLLRGVRLRDQNSVASLETIIAAKELLFELFCNGRLQILEMATDFLIAESKPFIPKNMFVDPDGHRADIERLTALLISRRSAL